MDWPSILGGGAAATIIAALIKGVEVLVNRRGMKETHELARAKMMSEGSESEFKRSWHEINTLWAREAEREKVLTQVRAELATALAIAGRVPELEERLAVVERHFLDCANLLSRIRNGTHAKTPAEARREEAQVESELDRIEREGKAITLRNGAGKGNDHNVSTGDTSNAGASRTRSRSDHNSDRSSDTDSQDGEGFTEIGAGEN